MTIDDLVKTCEALMASAPTKPFPNYVIERYGYTFFVDDSGEICGWLSKADWELLQKQLEVRSDG